MSRTLVAPAPFARLRDLVELGKPRLSFLVIFTAATGVWLAGSSLGVLRTVGFLIATSCLVAAANTLNCWIETELDARMRRTRNRPLPAGRLDPRTALTSGLIVGTGSLTALALVTNPLTTWLGALALVSYVLVYTPLKRITPWAVVVGALPGALPPLMGWTAATNGFGTPGWVLFGILFFWQLPHFIAISLYLREDFERAGFRVLPLVKGDASARRYLFLSTILLVGVSLTPQPLGMTGSVYTAVAAVLGVLFLALASGGLRSTADATWARKLFGYTLLYLPIVVTALVLATI